jgi:hypothetical protein
MPPGFISASCAPASRVAASCASAITWPSGAFAGAAVCGSAAPMRPTTRWASGRASFRRRRSASVWRGSLAKLSVRTMTLSALALVTSPVFGSSTRSISVTMVPYLSPLVTRRPSMRQL